MNRKDLLKNYEVKHFVEAMVVVLCGVLVLAVAFYAFMDRRPAVQWEDPTIKHEIGTEG